MSQDVQRHVAAAARVGTRWRCSGRGAWPDTGAGPWRGRSVARCGARSYELPCYRVSAQVPHATAAWRCVHVPTQDCRHVPVRVAVDVPEEKCRQVKCLHGRPLLVKYTVDR